MIELQFLKFILKGANMVETCVLTLGELMSGKVANDKIKVCKEVAQYFNDKKYQLTIPFYQRAYVWSEDTVNIMLEDIDEQIKENEVIKKHNETNPLDKKAEKRYLLGSLIIHIDDKDKKDEVQGENNNDKNSKKVNFNIVDGQQRLTTLDLVLGGDWLQCKDTLTQEKDTKYNARKTIDTWFNSRNKGEFVDYLKNNIEFVCVFTDRIDDAFIFFDSANAKGKRLKSYDLIKAFQLRA